MTNEQRQKLQGLCDAVNECAAACRTKLFLDDVGQICLDEPMETKEDWADALKYACSRRMGTGGASPTRSYATPTP